MVGFLMLEIAEELQSLAISHAAESLFQSPEPRLSGKGSQA